MVSPDFYEKLFLMVIDKLAIAAVIAGLVFFGQRKIEAFKGRQSFEVEISKERVKHIADEWEAMNAWDSAVGQLIGRFTDLILAEQPQLSTGLRLTELVPQDLKTTAELLARLQRKPDAETLIKNRCQEVLRPYLDESKAKALVVNEKIQQNRFWLGKELYEHCRRFQRRLGNVCVAFDHNDYEQLRENILSLDDERDDVLMTLKKI
jgi:hypothetical protein